MKRFKFKKVQQREKYHSTIFGKIKLIFVNLTVDVSQLNLSTNLRITLVTFIDETDISD